jgi:hypothetical protein
MTGVRRNLDDVVYEEDGYHHNSYHVATGVLRTRKKM